MHNRIGRPLPALGLLFFAACTGNAGEHGDNGANGFNSLVSVIAFTAGGGTAAQDRACPSGGDEIDTGLDDGADGGVAADGVLQPGEVTSTSYVCDGAPGAAGATGTSGAGGDAGANGFSSLAVTTSFAAGEGTGAQDASCPNGGAEIDSGLDDGAGGGIAGDGILETGEVTSVSYVCNGSNGSNGDAGANGANGYSSLTVSESFAAGEGTDAGNAACPSGGVEIESGLDDGANGGVANDGVLEAGEVTSVSFACNGASVCAATASEAMTSCAAIHTACPTERDGVYWIDPGGATPFQVDCDMTTNGGGWAIIFQSADPSIWKTDSGTPGIGAWSQDFSAIDYPMTELMLVYPAAGEYQVVTGVDASGIYACSGTGELKWAGLDENDFDAYHLGVVNPAVAKSPDDYVDVGGFDCVQDVQGWGFGHLAFENDAQGWGWDSTQLGSTVFAIGIR